MFKQVPPGAETRTHCNAFKPRMETPPTEAPSFRDRLGRLAPRSSRVRALLLATAALLAFALAFELGKASADARAPLRTAGPLVPSSQAVDIRGLPAARLLPPLRPRPEPASSRSKSRKPVLIVGEG
jgi:hypothetical protein